MMIPMNGENRANTSQKPFISVSAPTLPIYSMIAVAAMESNIKLIPASMNYIPLIVRPPFEMNNLDFYVY